MSSAAWTTGIILWLSTWIFLSARRTAAQDGDALVETLATLLPAFAVTSCLSALLLAPAESRVGHVIVLLVHHTAFLVLFAFLLVAEYLQLEALFKMRAGSEAASIVGTFRRIWTFTKVIPSTAAPVILLTGLHLIRESPAANSPAAVWLLVILVGFGFLFFDGILSYTPIVLAWYKYWNSAEKFGLPTEKAATSFRWRGWVQLLLHCLSWPILFLLALYRYDAPNAISDGVRIAEHQLDFLPAGWPEVVTAVGILCAAALVAVLAMALRNLSAGKVLSGDDASIRPDDRRDGLAPADWLKAD
jgi:hypothetical protein